MGKAWTTSGKSGVRGMLVILLKKKIKSLELKLKPQTDRAGSAPDSNLLPMVLGCWFIFLWNEELSREQGKEGKENKESQGKRKGGEVGGETSQTPSMGVHVCVSVQVNAALFHIMQAVFMVLISILQTRRTVRESNVFKLPLGGWRLFLASRRP